MNQSQPTRGALDFDATFEAGPVGLEKILKSIEDGSIFRKPCMRSGKSSRSQKSSYSTMEILLKSKSIEYGSVYRKPCMRKGKSSGSQTSSDSTMEKVSLLATIETTKKSEDKTLYGLEGLEE